MEDLAWNELGKREEIVLIVSDPVLTELDEQKDIRALGSEGEPRSGTNSCESWSARDRRMNWYKHKAQV